MSRLNETVNTLFTPDVLDSLFKRNIFTVLNFVETNAELLAKVTGLHYKQILQIRDSMFTQYAPSLSVGNVYYKEVLEHGAMVPSNIKNLDFLLDGGFTTGNIYELCGVAGSGKTQICATFAVNVCISLNQPVVYIDTKNDIAAHRVLEIIENHPSKVKDVGSVMGKLIIYQVLSPYELISVCHELSKGKDGYYRLIVVDSLAALFFGFLGESQSEGLNILNSVTNMLQYLAVEHHSVVMVTNLATTWTEEGAESESQQVHRAGLGKYWSHIPSTRINIQQLSNSDECLLTVIKSCTSPVGRSAKVLISNKGVS